MQHGNRSGPLLLLSAAAIAYALVAAGCSRGAPAVADGPVAVHDMGADDARRPADLSVLPIPTCTWLDRFQQLYGHPWDPADVAFVTQDGVVTRGAAQLDLEAQKNQVPDIVQVKGSSSPVQQIELMAPASTTVLASHSGPYIYGLGYAMWLDVNGYGESGITEATLVRQFGMETPSYQQLVGLFRVLTKTAEAQVPAADLADFRTAAAQLMGTIESGGLTFAMGTGHAADFPQTAQVVNGKTFSFQLSDGYGLDPQLGFQRDGTWGPNWQTYSPSGGWSASAPGMQPKCNGCTVDAWSGVKYRFCSASADRASAESTCRSFGGDLATVNDLFANSFLRALAPDVGGAFIGLNDLATPGKYLWATGQAATYFDWAPGKPGNGMDQRCVQLLDASASTQWSDLNCALPQSAVCQLP
jgi:hypothetical protein